MHLNLTWVWCYSCQMWMLHWCLFCLLVHLKLEMKNVAKIYRTLFCWCFYSVMSHGKAFIYKKSFYSLFTAHLFRRFIRRLVCRVFAFLHLGHQLWKNKKKGWRDGFWGFLPSKHIPPTFSGVKNTVGLGVADVATFGFAVMLKSADLTEVMFAPATGKRV